MGAAWCRERARCAHDSKSTLDRVIVSCVDKLYPHDPADGPAAVRATAAAAAGGQPAAGGACGDRADGAGGERPAGTGPGGGGVLLSAGAWQRASLQVPGPGPEPRTEPEPEVHRASAPAGPRDRAPVPPPRRKRQMRRKLGVARPPPPRPPCPAPQPDDAPAKPRPKNLSTVSLPNWSELEAAGAGSDSDPPRRPSSAAGSPRPRFLGPPSLSSVSEATVERVETYMRRCRSFGSMPSGGLADRLSNVGGSSDSEDDAWGDIEDFDHVFQSGGGGGGGSPPLTPRSRLPGRPRPEKHTPAAQPPPPPPPPADGAVTRGRFVVSSAEDDWFKGEYHREKPENETAKPAAAHPETPQPASADESGLTDVKRELQSIIYDYNRVKKLSASSMEVLPTQPVQPARPAKKKKISVASLTPPPSPVASDLEDGSPAVPPSAVINGEPLDADTHSTLLRILRECQTIEGALEQLGMEEAEVPAVHSALQGLRHNNRHLKAGTKESLKSVDSGLDVSGGQGGAREADSGLEDPEEPRPDSAPGAAAKPGVDGENSSGRSSMTPSLSELEAALSDMLEKSAAAAEAKEGGKEGDAASLPPAGPAAASTPAAAAPEHKPIPTISVTAEGVC